MTTVDEAVERVRALAEGAMQPHEWGYRDPVVGGFVEDRTPFDLADRAQALLSGCGMEIGLTALHSKGIGTETTAEEIGLLGEMVGAIKAGMIDSPSEDALNNWMERAVAALSASTTDSGTGQRASTKGHQMNRDREALQRIDRLVANRFPSGATARQVVTDVAAIAQEALALPVGDGRTIEQSSKVADPHVAFLNEAARYFEKRPTGGEDAAFWANVANAETCRKIAALSASTTDSGRVDAEAGGWRLLQRCYAAIGSLPWDALGFAEDEAGRWPVREELLQKLEQFLSRNSPATPTGEGGGL